MNAAISIRTSNYIAARFFWKEFRRLRGLAIGIGFLAVVLVLLISTIMRENDLAGFALLIATGAPVIFAVGGSIVLFAVEHEEGTRGWLQLLPTDWRATLLGKLTALVMLTLALAVSLFVFACFVWPAAIGSNALYLGVRQSAVFSCEVIAWGVLLSLVCPKPLLAAVLACAATSLNSQLAIALSVARTSGYGIAGLDDSIPIRLGLAGLVLLIDTLLARRWLVVRPKESRPRVLGRRDETFPTAESATPIGRDTQARRAIAPQHWLAIGDRRSSAAFARLWWQTLRESWLAMLLVIVGGTFLTLANALLFTVLAGDIGRWPIYPGIVTVLFVPALLGAYTFANDQSRGSYQFLANHAASPRLVWLSRLLTWFVPLLGLTVFAVGLAHWFIFTKSHDHSFIEVDVFNTFRYEWITADNISRDLLRHDIWVYVLLNFTLGIFAAFSLGQLISLLVRSPVLAAGGSLLASVAIVHWCGLVGVWRLPPIWFILPLVFGPLVASYLRTRDWLVDRHRIGRWLAVSLSVAIPIAALLFVLPAYRYEQADTAKRTLTGIWQNSAALSPQAIAEFDERRRAAEVVASDYRNLTNDIWGDGGFGNVRGKPDDAVPWFGSDYHLTHDELPSLAVQIEQPQIEKLFELTREPAMALPTAALRSLSNDKTATKQNNAELRSTDRELSALPYFAAILIGNMQLATEAGELDRAFDYHLAYTRFIGQIWQNDSFGYNVGWLVQSCETMTGADERLVEWALAPGQTPERIERAYAALLEAECDYPPFSEAVLMERSIIEDVILGNSGPRGLQTGWDNPYQRYSLLALLLHEMPGERERALVANDALATDYLGVLDKLSSGGVVFHENGTQSRIRPAEFRSWLRLLQLDNRGQAAFNMLVQHSRTKQRLRALDNAKTSLLVNSEWPDGYRLYNFYMVRQSWQTLRDLRHLRLALIGYHIEHGEYPKSLRDLVPNYVPLVADLFSETGWPEYKPEGFDLPAFGHVIGTRGYHNANAYRRFESEQPLIWSVGPANVIPVEATRLDPTYKRDIDANLSDEELDKLMVHGFYFDATEGYDKRFVAVPLPRDEEYRANDQAPNE